MITLSIYTHLFEDAFDSVMDRLDAAHRELVRPKGGQTSSSFRTEAVWSQSRGLASWRGVRAVEGDGLENR